MFCKHCGAPVGDRDTVCGSCGALTVYGEQVSRHDALPPQENNGAVNPDGSLNRDAYRPAQTAMNPNANYYYAPQNAAYSHQNVSSGSNNMAVAGFVCAFFAPLLGLIFSILGYNKAKNYNGDKKGLALAGIILSIVMLIVNAFYSSYLVRLIFERIDYGVIGGFML